MRTIFFCFFLFSGAISNYSKLHSQSINNTDSIVSPPPLTALNSKLSEFAPVISLDGKTLYFCRAIGINEEVIFTAEYLDSTWINIQPIHSLKSETNRAPIAISSDGTRLYLSENGKIKESNKEKNNWSKPVSLGDAFDTFKWQGGLAISTDNKVRIFAGVKTDTITDYQDQSKDFFISFLEEDGHWSTPINLGEQINTPSDERSPFLHPDGKTLYFSSDGHKGFGGLDIFTSTRIDDTWLNWEEPINLGKPINTSEDDWGCTITTDGKKAFFSSSSLTGEDQDIYLQDLPKPLQPKVILEKLIIRNLDTLLTATITIINKITGDTISKKQPNAPNKHYINILPRGILVFRIFEIDGYYPIIDQFDTRDNEIEEYETDTTLTPIIVKTDPLPIKNLFFNTGKSEINPTSFSSLNKLALRIIQQDLSIILEGHTDSVGSIEYNLRLSRRRAEAVQAYLIQAGCAASNIQSKGYGETNPKKENNTEEGRAENRRVDIRKSN